MRYFPQTDVTIDVMLKTINKKSVADLFSSIPKTHQLKEPLKLPPRLDERSLKQQLTHFATPTGITSFLGAGATEHFVPEWVSQQLLRAEWYTSYTPYQPEASQGTLQAIFEFQSMIASLFGLSVANASMYDGATALVEALLLAVRVTGKKTVVMSQTIHPEYRETVKTYFKLADLEVVEINFATDGVSDWSELASKIDMHSLDLAAVALQSPNFFGRLENIVDIAKKVHAHNALIINVTTDITSLALLNSPGHGGADIAVGDGIGLLGGLSLGGPSVGLFACKNSLLRQMPGRLVGQTTDQFGKRGFVLTLSTREQHIRREKATSNICTNHNLMALALSMTLAAYGKSGLKTLAKTNIKKTLYLRQCLKEHGIEVAFMGPHYNETVVKFTDDKTLHDKLTIASQHNVIAGVPLAKFYPTLNQHLLIATTELHDDRDIKTLAHILSGKLS